MPAKLRMNFIGTPGVNKADFELWCLAVSAINGCGMCIDSREKVLRNAGFMSEQIQAAVRITPVVHAVAAPLDGKAHAGGTAAPALAAQILSKLWQRLLQPSADTHRLDAGSEAFGVRHRKYRA